MKNILALIIVLTILTSCVKVDQPVTGVVVEHHERKTEHSHLYYIELDKDRVILVSFEVFLVVDDGETCTFSGTGADNPHWYRKVKCQIRHDAGF